MESRQDSLLKDSYTTRELMNLLNISDVTLYKLVKAGKLNPIMMGSKYVFFKDDVERFIKERQANRTSRKPNNDKKAAK